MTGVETLCWNNARDEGWRAEDNCWDLHSRKDGLYLSEIIKTHKGNLPVGEFLGLGAGAGKGELVIAHELGFSQITLVDKHPRSIISSSEVVVDYLQEDIFSFIENNKRENYSLVTALGIEYVLDTTETWKRFWTGMDGVVKSGGLIILSLTPHDEISYQDSFIRTYYDRGTFIAVRK